MSCEVCTHTKRDEIEQSLICRSLGDSSITIDSIAKEFAVSTRELQVHALMHTYREQYEAPEPDAGGAGESEGPTTITAAIKYKEAQVLQSTSQEYYGTLKNLGAKINGMISQHTDDNPTLHKLSKSTVDLYLGLGSEIRGTMELLLKMNTAFNGETNSGITALGELVLAVRKSGGADGGNPVQGI